MWRHTKVADSVQNKRVTCHNCRPFKKGDGTVWAVNSIPHNKLHCRHRHVYVLFCILSRLSQLFCSYFVRGIAFRGMWARVCGVVHHFLRASRCDASDGKGVCFGRWWTTRTESIYRYRRGRRYVLSDIDEITLMVYAVPCFSQRSWWRWTQTPLLLLLLMPSGIDHLANARMHTHKYTHMSMLVIISSSASKRFVLAFYAPGRYQEIGRN